jgi:hypothetical protein
MAGLSENIEDLLTELVEKSRHELNVMLALADAIRRTDEQLLREVQSVTLNHEMRRAEIKGELQALASRLCAIPQLPLADRTGEHVQRARQAIPDAKNHEQPVDRRSGWNHAAEDIDAEIDEAFGAEFQRH